MTTQELSVVKVGGSLLELPDLGVRLRRWLDENLPGGRLVLAGGGQAVDVIRRLDHVHAIGQERSHWLAIRVLSLNAAVLAARLPRARLVTHVESCAEIWNAGGTPVLDPQAFLQEDESHGDPLPHTWDVTSDSIAARIAIVAGAAEIVLLKSRDVPQGAGWDQLASEGVVDGWFPRLAASVPAVRVVNFRAAP